MFVTPGAAMLCNEQKTHRPDLFEHNQMPYKSQPITKEISEHPNDSHTLSTGRGSITALYISISISLFFF